MKISRRNVLRGLGGATLALPLLEGLQARKAAAADLVPAFAVFFRQACGVACAQETDEIGSEPERFWPRTAGVLTPTSLEGRALDELSAYADRLLVVGNVNMVNYDFGDGHARGALQTLTARGPMVEGAGGDSEASGESLDHRIGRELNPGGRESLFLYGGPNGGWLGGACISYRGPGQRRAAIRNPWSAYQAILGSNSGIDPEQAALVARRQKSVNDLVRDQMQSLIGSSSLSKGDRRRLELHFDAIRDVEVALSCRLADDQARLIQTGSSVYDSTNGEDVITTIKLQMEVAAIAIACGHTRSVAIQTGNGNDGNTRFLDPESGKRMENYHYISHRRSSHDAKGTVIAGSDLLHHKIDRYFGQMFKHLLDKLDAYEMPSGKRLLDHGVAVWHNDNGNGPGHSAKNVPFILAGSANGFLKQGQYITVPGDRNTTTHNKVLNTIGSAVGLRSTAGNLLEDFGDPANPKGIVPELVA